MQNNKNFDRLGTKAETLLYLSKLGFTIPKIYFFTVDKWESSRSEVLKDILTIFKRSNQVAVRSSSLIEDTEDSSMAGAFQSFLNIDVIDKNLIIKEILKRLFRIKFS